MAKNLRTKSTATGGSSCFPQRHFVWLLISVGLLWPPFFVFAKNDDDSKSRIAIIGGGVSGTFTSKYLVDYDGAQCKLESITIFDPYEIGGGGAYQANIQDKNSTTNAFESGQGNRVAAVRLDDNRIVELGASVFHEANYYLKDMIANDPSLEIGKPFNVGINVTGTSNRVKTRDGLGIYDGNGEWLFMSNSSAPMNTFWTLLRYNLDLYKVDRATQRAQSLFSTIPSLLEDTDTFFSSPDEMWNRVGLIKPVHMSFDKFLDSIGVSSAGSWIRQWIPYQGSLRTELLTALNLINYNQLVSQVNGLVGLVSFAASKGPLYSLVGGNHQMIQSAFRQAQSNSHQNCQRPDIVTHDKRRIRTVIGSMDGFELFDTDSQLIGLYDAVVLAAPLQQANIDFLIPSHFDSAVLQPMPLADGMVDPERTDARHEGHAVLPKPLPECARKPFTQVVTTVVSNATLRNEILHIDEDKLPRAVCLTEQGKRNLHNITIISQIAGDGIYKVFSSQVLPSDLLVDLFGPQVKQEFVKVWGATPDYNGRGQTVQYMLYDGATGLEGHTPNGALYYPNAIEGALACMEASAIGAKSVAKLLAKRFFLIKPTSTRKYDGEEL